MLLFSFTVYCNCKPAWSIHLWCKP